MKLCIVIQEDAFRASAGMRIRYDRFAACLADGDTIEARTCAEVAALRTLDCDVYIFCKTFDLDAALLARRVRSAGKVVGQDLFDDYFSQVRDPRLERYRDWLRAMAPATDFAICSTPRMVEVARSYMPDLPIAAIDDPVSGYDPLAIAALTETKMRRSLATRVLEVAWFGIGDNPFFPVGIADLAAFEGELARIERRGWSVRLKLVTNVRPFGGAGLAALRALSVEHEVVAWTEASERAALLEAGVAMLPVNAQPFSRAKSLNRAITAINGGCQVLSLGFPLYERLDEFIYRSADALVDDIEAGRCRLRAQTMVTLTERLSELADPFKLAASFVAEARGAMAATPHRPPPPLFCLVHGRETSITAHKAAIAMGGLSIATPFCTIPWNFTVRFDIVAGTLRMRAADAVAKRFDLPVVEGARRTMRIVDLDFVEVDLAALDIAPMAIFQPVGESRLRDLAVHEDVLRHVERCCRAAFGRIDLVVSDAGQVRRPLETSLHAGREAA